MANGVLLIVWLSAVAALFVIPAWLDRRPTSTPRGTEWAPGRFVIVTAAIFLAISTGVAAATGAWTGRRYLITAPAAARDAALMLDELGRCTICYSSAHGPIGAKDAAVGARRLLIDLEAIDPSVAARHEAWTLPGYSDWLEMPDGFVRGSRKPTAASPPTARSDTSCISGARSTCRRWRSEGEFSRRRE